MQASMASLYDVPVHQPVQMLYGWDSRDGLLTCRRRREQHRIRSNHTGQPQVPDNAWEMTSGDSRGSSATSAARNQLQILRLMRRCSSSNIVRFLTKAALAAFLFTGSHRVLRSHVPSPSSRCDR